MRLEEMRELFAFNAWANHRVLGAVEALSVEQFTKPMGSSFSSVRDTLVHIYGAEWIWLERLHGNSPTVFPEGKDFPDLGSLRAKWSAEEDRATAYLGKISQAELEEVIEYKTFSYGTMKNARWQALQHVVNHGTYHRGQVVTMLRQLGAKGVATDLIGFYRERSTAAKA